MASRSIFLKTKKDPPPGDQKSENYAIFGRKIHPHLGLYNPVTKDLDYEYTSEPEKNMYFFFKL